MQEKRNDLPSADTAASGAPKAAPGAKMNERIVTIQAFVRESTRNDLDRLAKDRGISRQAIAGIMLDTAMEGRG